MPYNVGQTATFSWTATGTNLRYVWRWWDGTVTATRETTVTKVVNIGGDITNGNELLYTAEAVDDFGQSVSVSGSITANNPPSVLPELTMLGNDLPVGSTISLSTTVYFLDSGASLTGTDWTFFPADGSASTDLGSGTTTAGPSVVPAYGGAIAVPASFPTSATSQVVSLSFQSTVSGTMQLTLTGSNGSTTVVSFPVLVGTATPTPASPLVGNLLLGDASEQSVVTIGTGQTATFFVFAPAGTVSGQQQPVMTFHYSMANGWSANSTSTPAPSLFANGVIECTDSHDVSKESPGLKYVNVTLSMGYSAGIAYKSLVISVTLVAPQPPQLSQIATNPANARDGQAVQFQAVASDPQEDLLFYQWVFTIPPCTLWGHTVDVDSTGLGGATITGMLTVTDRYGATATQVVPGVPVSAA